MPNCERRVAPNRSPQLIEQKSRGGRELPHSSFRLVVATRNLERAAIQRGPDGVSHRRLLKLLGRLLSRHAAPRRKHVGRVRHVLSDPSAGLVRKPQPKPGASGTRTRPASSRQSDYSREKIGTMVTVLIVTQLGNNEAPTAAHGCVSTSPKTLTDAFPWRDRSSHGGTASARGTTRRCVSNDLCSSDCSKIVAVLIALDSLA